MKTRLLACMLVAMLESSLFANAGSFGGSGHTIELSHSDQIQMVSEEVTITPLPGFQSELDQVEYRCGFVLKNLSPTATTIQVGFPLDGELVEDSPDADDPVVLDIDETDRVILFVWYGTSLPRDASQCEFVVRQLMGPHPQKIEVFELAEIVGAFYGIAPKSDSVKEFVERQVWYHPKSGLERSALTDEQQETLA